MFCGPAPPPPLANVVLSPPTSPPAAKDGLPDPVKDGTPDPGQTLRPRHLRMGVGLTIVLACLVLRFNVLVTSGGGLPRGGLPSVAVHRTAPSMAPTRTEGGDVVNASAPELFPSASTERASMAGTWRGGSTATRLDSWLSPTSGVAHCGRHPLG